jgi:hypothetical protein
VEDAYASTARIGVLVEFVLGYTNSPVIHSLFWAEEITPASIVNFL